MISPRLTGISILCACLLFSACSNQAPIKRSGKTLADYVEQDAHLAPAAFQQAEKESSHVSRRYSAQDMIKRYQAILDIHTDPDVIARAKKRIADLSMIAAENQQYAETETNSTADQYGEVIKQYQQALADYPDSSQNEEILYQLAKAHDYQGNTDATLASLNRLDEAFPASTYRVETAFRRGDIYYSRKDYRTALQAYQVAITEGEGTPFLLNANYMKGWTLFKLGLYEPAAQSFTTVLDGTLAEQELEDVADKHRPLARDTLRIMSVIFSYLDNGNSIATLYEQLGQRPYEPALYENLADLLLQRKLHQAAIDTLSRFISEYPMHAKAPYFQARRIGTIAKAGYRKAWLPAQAQFMQDYGLHSEYWVQASEDTRQFIREQSTPYIDNLATHYHASAQRLKKRNKSDLASEAYSQAAQWYQQWVEFYPGHDETPVMVFLLGESLYESHAYEKAIQWYEQSAYAYDNHNQSEEAGYAAIVAYTDWLVSTPEDSHEYTLRLRERIASQGRFVDRFTSSPHRSKIQVNMANILFELGDYAQAIQHSQHLIAREINFTDAQQHNLQLVIANSAFKLEDYVLAEKTYDIARNQIKNDKTAWSELTEHMAASIYKQGENAIANEKLKEAVTHFRRVLSKTPDASIRKQAHYDAATYLLKLEAWQEAVDLLTLFRQQWPKDPLAQDMPAKLILAWEGMEQWSKAALELRFVWQNSKDKNESRQALFLAAEYFAKSDKNAMALNSYRTWANTYKEPFDLLIEAQYRLSEIYREKQDSYKRNFWLKRLIKSEQEQSTERSRYLAAFAIKALAEPDYEAFVSIRLTLPLDKSLKKKQKAFEKVLKHYQQLDAYHVADFSTFATHRIADLYYQLGQDLLNAEKPDGLSELELEQYNVLLEEQAYPFEEDAIVIFEQNAQRSWQGVYDTWVQRSFSQLTQLMPARYDKPEIMGVDNDKLY